MAATEKLGVRQKKLIEDLQSADKKTVLGALKKVPSQGTHHVIASLIEILNNNEDDDILQGSIKILYDLKDGKSLEPLIEGIKASESQEVKRILIAALWESSLDATEHLIFLVENAVNNEFMVSFECVTVIENLDGPFNDDEVFECVNTVQEALLRKPEHEALLQGLIEVLHDKVIG